MVSHADGEVGLRQGQLGACSLLSILGDGSSDSVHVGEALLGESLAVNVDLASLRGLDVDGADEGGLLELLEAVADDLTGRPSGVLRAGTVSLVGAVVLAESVDAGLAANVQLVGNGGSADVEPVGVVRREILLATGLIIGGPLGMSDLVTLLEVSGEGLNELVSGNVLDGNTLIGVDDAELNL